MFHEHEIDEVLGWEYHLNSPRPEFLEPTDLFSWASLNARNTSASGQRFFSIDRGFHFIAQFNQNPEGIYETQPQQICGHFALRICGHHLLSYNVGNHAWTGRRTWNRKDAKNWRVIFRRRRSLARGDAKAMRGRA